MDDTERKANEMPKPKIKHDWYQTDFYVVVTILAKNTENVKVQYGESTLSVSATLPSGGEYSLELDLADFIVPEHCSYKVSPSKVEITLRKQAGHLMWATLEGDPKNLCKMKPIPGIPSPRELLEADQRPLNYPSSSKIHKNWDSVVKEIVQQEAIEENHGEAAVNSLFQNIYGTGSDEVRRAMNKSFIESGGTVLSTNWKDVGQNTVQRKPPDGMEWKTWNS